MVRKLYKCVAIYSIQHQFDLLESMGETKKDGQSARGEQNLPGILGNNISLDCLNLG